MTVASEITARGGILVGHDGSSAAESALWTAVRCAPAFGNHIEVVRAWNIFSAPRPLSMTHTYMPSLEEFEATALAALEADVQQAGHGAAHVSITCSVVHGDVAGRLIKASHGFEMIVLGHRGLGGFVGLLLGSVSEQVVRHARCSVLVDKGSSPVTPGPDVTDRRTGADLGRGTEKEPDEDQARMERALLSELKLEATE